MLAFTLFSSSHQYRATSLEQQSPFRNRIAWVGRDIKGQLVQTPHFKYSIMQQEQENWKYKYTVLFQPSSASSFMQEVLLQMHSWTPAVCAWSCCKQLPSFCLLSLLKFRFHSQFGKITCDTQISWSLTLSPHPHKPCDSHFQQPHSQGIYLISLLSWAQRPTPYRGYRQKWKQQNCCFQWWGSPTSLE